MLGLAGGVSLGAYILLLIVDGRRHGYVGLPGTDPANLVSGARVAVDCVRHGTWTHCGSVAGGAPPVVSRVHAFPLLQYLPAAVLIEGGLATLAVLHGLVWVNTFAFIGTLVCLWLVGRRVLGAGWASLLMVLGVTGPLSYYAVASLGEMLATFFMTLFVSAVLVRRPLLAACALAVACLSKETAAPILLVVGVLAARDAHDGILPPRRWLFPLLAGAGVGTSLNMLFNVFRFGTVQNSYYLHANVNPPGIHDRLNFSLAMWFGTNTGLLFYWTLGTLLLVAVAGVVGWRVCRSPRDAHSWLPGLALLVVVAATTWGLASWWSPFGWVAWGPRLMVPFVPAFVLVGVYVVRDDINAVVRTVLRSVAGIVLVIGVATLALLPEVGVVWNSAPAAKLFYPDARCPKWGSYNISTESRDYYRCARYTAWRTDRFMLPATADVAGVVPRVADGLLGGAVALLLIVSRRRIVGGSRIAAQRESAATAAGRAARVRAASTQRPLNSAKSGS